jgi:hypothetical protein
MLQNKTVLFCSEKKFTLLFDFVTRLMAELISLN